MDRLWLIALVKQELPPLRGPRPKVVLETVQEAILMDDLEELRDLPLVVVEHQSELAQLPLALAALPVDDRGVVQAEMLLLLDRLSCCAQIPRHLAVSECFAVPQSGLEVGFLEIMSADPHHQGHRVGDAGLELPQGPQPDACLQRIGIDKQPPLSVARLHASLRLH